MSTLPWDHGRVQVRTGPDTHPRRTGRGPCHQPQAGRAAHAPPWHPDAGTAALSRLRTASHAHQLSICLLRGNPPLRDALARMVGLGLIPDAPYRRRSAARWRFARFSLREAAAPPDGGAAAVNQSSTCSAMLRASSTSIPRYRTVLSSLVCPSSNWTARRFPVLR
jgi:hypothetical protein